jgi:hypothetical protein
MEVASTIYITEVSRATEYNPEMLHKYRTLQQISALWMGS